MPCIDCRENVSPTPRRLVQQDSVCCSSMYLAHIDVAAAAGLGQCAQALRRVRNGYCAHPKTRALIRQCAVRGGTGVAKEMPALADSASERPRRSIVRAWPVTAHAKEPQHHADGEHDEPLLPIKAGKPVHDIVVITPHRTPAKPPPAEPFKSSSLHGGRGPRAIAPALATGHPTGIIHRSKPALSHRLRCFHGRPGV